jgi:hypothetical protein
MGGVSITISKGNLGSTLQTADGVCGLVITGQSTAAYTLGTVLLLTSLQDAVSAGWNETDDAFGYKQIKEFYAVAGDGAQLYVLPVSNTITLSYMTDYSHTANSVRTLLEYAQGAVKLVGIMTKDSEVYSPVVTTHAINEDVLTCMANFNTTLNNFAGIQQPARGLIAGTSYTGVPANLSSLLTHAQGRVAVMLGDTASGSGCALGLVLGKLASVTVETKISRVADGPITTIAYLATASADTKRGDWTTIAGKGYISWTQYATKSGFFLNGDATATPTTDDFHSLVNGRVIDKAQLIAYATYINYVDDKVPTVDGGKPEPMWAKGLEQKVKKALDETLVAAGEAVLSVVSVPLNQQVLADSQLDTSVRVQPYGYNSTINVDLGLTA